MHSRIFQLSESPISKEDYITEELFYDDFVGQIADYVDDSTEREEDIKWLINTIEKYGATYNEKEQSIVFLKGFKDSYFKERFQKLKEVIQNMNLSEFSTGFMKVYELKDLIEDEYGFYIYYNDSYAPIDAFVREDVEEGKKYFIGNVLDYHF